MKKCIVSGVAIVIVVLSTILFPSIAMAKVYFVGDENGWRPGVNYQAWPANKFFAITFLAGEDHVYEVDGPSFRSCRIPEASSGGSGSGFEFDIVSLRSLSLPYVFGPFVSLPLAPAPSP